MIVTCATGDVDIECVGVTHPRSVHVDHFNIVADDGWWRIVRIVAARVERNCLRVTALPFLRFGWHARIGEDEQRVGLHDVATVRARTGERGLFVIVHVVRDEHFVEVAVGLRDKHWGTAYVQAVGPAPHPVSGVSGREQELSVGRPHDGRDRFFSAADCDQCENQKKPLQRHRAHVGAPQWREVSSRTPSSKRLTSSLVL